MNSEQHSIKETILKRIERDGIHMHSRGYFMLRIIALILLAAAVLVVSVFITTFIFFTLRLNGHDMLPGLGGPGILLFLRFFPWHLLVLDLVLIVLLRYLLQTFSVAYRTPWIYAVFALAIISISGGLVLDRETRVNDMLLHRSDRGQLPPPLNDLYRGARRPPPPDSGAYRGVVTNVATSSITFTDAERNDASYTVVLPNLPAGASMPLPKKGDVIFVIGSSTADGIHPVAIRVIDPDSIPPQ